MKLHYYGVIFWNEQTNQEIAAYLEAESHWHAQQIVEPIELPGFIKGGATYIEAKDKEFYNVPLDKISEAVK